MKTVKLTTIEKISIYKLAKSELINLMEIDKPQCECTDDESNDCNKCTNNIGLCSILTSLLDRALNSELEEKDLVQYCNTIEFIRANIMEFVDDFNYETMCQLMDRPHSSKDGIGYWWPLEDYTSRLSFLDKLIEKNERELLEKDGIILTTK